MNVVEKPSVVKSVSEILSGGRGLHSHKGRSWYNRVFKFEYPIAS